MSEKPVCPPMMETAPGARVVIDGQPYLYFAGTSYFGLHGHPDVIEAGVAALRKYGVHSATSRKGFGNSPPVLEVERRSAEMFAREEAFYFSSGYAANHILAQAVADLADVIFVEDAAHFCVLEAARVPGLPCHSFKAREPADLAIQLRQHLPPGKRPLVMGDAVVPPSGKLSPVHEYLEVLADFAPGVLMLDDAHGFGVLGENGRGLLEHAGLWDQGNSGLPGTNGIALVAGGTTAKALGGFGGLIPGSSQFMSAVRTSSHYFDGASAPAAAIAGSTAKALELVANDPGYRLRLRANVAQLQSGLRALGIEVHDSPAAQTGVVIGDEANMRRIHLALKMRGILVPHVSAYSGIGPEGLMRFAVCSAHTPDMIEELLAALKALL